MMVRSRHLISFVNTIHKFAQRQEREVRQAALRIVKEGTIEEMEQFFP